MGDILRRILIRLSVKEDAIDKLLKLNQKPDHILVTKLKQLEKIIFSEIDENDDIAELREDIILLWLKDGADQPSALIDIALVEPNTTSKESPKVTINYVDQMLKRILLKLNASKSITDELINMRPRKSKLPDLAEKLSIIEKNISDISKDESEFLNDWTELTVALWANYSSNYKRKCEKTKIDSSVNQKVTQASTSKASRNGSKKEIDQTKETIIVQITNAFIQVTNVENNEDIYSMEGLMTVINRVVDYFNSANEETSRTLELEMLNYALAKLPKQMVNAFRLQPQEKEYQTVHELKTFLQAAISRIYDRVKVKKAVQIFRPLLNSDDSTSDGMSLLSGRRIQDHIPGVCCRCLKPGHLAIHCPSTNSIPDFDEIENTKINFRNHITSVFAKLPPVDDVDSMKRLYLLLAKVSVLPLPDQSFHGEIFGRSFSLLSSGNQDKYMLQPRRNPKTLRSLCTFLHDEIIDYFRSINLKYAAMLQSNREKNLFCNDLMKFCNYCRTAGHIWDDCNERKSCLCLICFQFGHNSKKCENELKVIGLEDLLQFDL